MQDALRGSSFDFSCAANEALAASDDVPTDGRPFVLFFDTGSHAHLCGPSPFLTNIREIPEAERVGTEAATGHRSVATRQGTMHLGFWTRTGKLVTLEITVHIQEA